MGKAILGGVEFCVDDGRLINVTNSGECKDVRIPDKLPTGEWIHSISPNFCYGNYNNIAISDNITVISPMAFAQANVNIVQWSSGCKVITRGCFCESSIKQIVNIDDVGLIEPSAFRNTNIVEFKWPSKCETIPSYCFHGSELKAISNIDNVKKN